MLMEFIATIALGLGAAGVVMVLRRITRNAIPRYAPPAAAGLVMIGFTIWIEYTWFSRTAATLPPEVVVTQSHAEPSAFRPWTYLVPFVNRFSAVDLASVRRNERVPGYVLFEVLLASRRGQVVMLPILVDCPGYRRANIVDGVTFDASGMPTGAEWHVLSPDDPLIGAVCSDTCERRGLDAEIDPAGRG